MPVDVVVSHLAHLFHLFHHGSGDVLLLLVVQLLDAHDGTAVPRRLASGPVPAPAGLSAHH